MSFTEDLKQGTNPYRKQALEILDFMKIYIKNPVAAIRQLPDWEWPVLLLLYAGFASVCGTISGLITLKISYIFSGLIIFPISSTIGGLLLSAFFYYIFLFLYKRDLPIKLFFTIVALSMLPYFALYTLASILAPVKLIGFAAAGILLITGLSEHTHVERKRIIQLISALYFVYFIYWAFNMINFRNETKKYKSVATPASFKKLEEEFKDSE